MQQEGSSSGGGAADSVVVVVVVREDHNDNDSVDILPLRVSVCDERRSEFSRLHGNNSRWLRAMPSNTRATASFSRNTHPTQQLEQEQIRTRTTIRTTIAIIRT